MIHFERLICPILWIGVGRDFPVVHIHNPKLINAAFRIKCFNRIRELISRAAVIFVSHQMSQVGRICTHGLLLQKGVVEIFGPNIGEIIERYNSYLDMKCGQRINTEMAYIRQIKVSNIDPERRVKVEAE